MFNEVGGEVVKRAKKGEIGACATTFMGLGRRRGVCLVGELSFRWVETYTS